MFHTAGLYVGIVWIILESASVLLAANEAPDSIIRWLIFLAFTGFPVILIFTWAFGLCHRRGEDWNEIDEAGDASDQVEDRRADYAVISVLTIALLFSMFLDHRGDGDDDVPEPVDPLSVLIADFENNTGDALFTNTLEQAMLIELEGAPFISAYSRDSALRVASTLQQAESVLDEDTARLVSTREGIQVVLTGSIEEIEGTYSLYVRAIDPNEGEVLASAEVDAGDRLEILSAVGRLADDIREGLGDRSTVRQNLQVTETFTASNLEAAHAYAQAQSLQYRGRYEEAMEYYRRAIDHDPDLGRAHSGLALSAFALGQTDISDHHWERALATLDTMTERERLRTLGLYYSIVTRDFAKAIETYEMLVERYPADDTAHNGLAVQYFFALEFDKALEQGGRLLEIYPNSVMGRSNYALYAMYASDFERAVEQAEQVREADATYFKAWLPIAMNALAEGELETAASAYGNMADANPRGQLTSSLGLADILLFSGDSAAARTQLQRGIDAATDAGSQYFLSTHLVARAEAEFLSGDVSTAMGTIDQALATADGLPRQVPAALLFIRAGETDRAREIAASLTDDMQPQNRAYGCLIFGLIELESGEPVAAVDAIYTGIAIADLWLLRFHLGRAYLEAGYPAEALDELTRANERIGEATSVFLDDLPTWRYTAELPYWLARAQQELGLVAPSQENYAAFIDRRQDSQPLGADARQRLKPQVATSARIPPAK